MSCVIWGCKSHSSRKENDVETVTFHRFPADISRRQLWIDKIAQKNWKWKKHQRICSKHFSPQCFDNIDRKWRRLKLVAVPSLYLHKERPTIVYSGDHHPSTIDSTRTPSTSAPITSFLTMSATSNSSSRERLLMIHVTELQQELEKLRKISKRRLLKINSLRQKTNRLKIKNADLILRLVDLIKKEKN